MKYNKFFVVMFLMMILGGVISLVSPLLLSIWSNETNGFTLERFVLLGLVLFLSIFIDLILTWFREKFAKGFNISNCKAMLSDFFYLNYDFVNDEGPTKLVNKISIAVNSIYAFMTGSFISIWASILTMVVILVMVATDNLVIALVMLMLIPVNYIGFKALNNSLLKRSERLTNVTASSWQDILSVAGQVDYFKQCDSYDEIFTQLNPAITQMYEAMADINIYAKGVSKFLSSINSFASVMLMASVVYGFINSAINPTRLILYSILFPLYFANLTVVTDSNLSKRDMIIARDYGKELKERRENDGTESIDSIDTIDLCIPRLMIKDRCVSLDIHGHFEKGDVVWIQGESGSGKSTLAKLFPKFRIEDSVFINGLDLRLIANSSIRRHISYLSQTVPIIRGTIRQNIFLNRKYTIEQEERILSDPIIQSLLRGRTMDTPVSEGGSSLSGGEKQKIAVARAMNDDVDIMILDEVTSNIDQGSSNDIMERLMQGKERRITFIISHDNMVKSYANKTIELMPTGSDVKDYRTQAQ